MGAVKMPWCSWRSRPMGPPAPRLGGRRPRRRLCFPPPAEGCPGPAFIFFLFLIPGLDHRPDCFVFPCGRRVQGVAQRAAHCAWLTANRLPADPTPHRLGAIRERCSTIFNLGAWSFAWRERPAWKHGPWEHLDVTHETADCARGECP